MREIVSVDSVEIQFIDYGTRTYCSKSDLYKLPDCFIHKPPSAICAQLLDIKPVNDGNWSLKAVNRFQELVCGTEMSVPVIVIGKFSDKVNNQKFGVELFIVSEDGKKENVSDILVREGFAINHSHYSKEDYGIRESDRLVPMQSNIQGMLENITQLLKNKFPVSASKRQTDALDNLKSDFRQLQDLIKSIQAEHVERILRFQMKVATKILIMGSETCDLFES